MTDKWFKPKRFGYGATPTNWKGWAFVGPYLAIVLIVVAFLVTEKTPILLGLAVIAALTIVLVAVTKAKTEGEWHWNWH